MTDNPRQNETGAQVVVAVGTVVGREQTRIGIGVLVPSVGVVAAVRVSIEEADWLRVRLARAVESARLLLASGST